MSVLGDALADLKGQGLLDRVVSLEVFGTGINEGCKLTMVPAAPAATPRRDEDEHDPLFDAS